MKKWNLLIDVEKCEDCNNCLLACKDEHVDNTFDGYSNGQPRQGHHWINILRNERGKYPFIDVAYLPVPCFHCDNAPCVKASKDGAVYKRADGIVMIDPAKAKDQRQIADSCPHNAIWWNETEHVAQKCTLCAHLLDEGWKEPRCVNSCPTGALTILKVDDNEMEKISARDQLEPYHPRPGFSHRVFYKNLYRFTHHFIGGSVAVNQNNVTDCVNNADVYLINDSGTVTDQTKTDTFGDFKFDKIENKDVAYQIKITHDLFGEKVISLRVQDESCYLGVIEM